jgi:cytochrome c-type biogenesis protein CcmH
MKPVSKSFYSKFAYFWLNPLPMIFVFLIFILFSSPGLAKELYPFQSAAKKQEFLHLSHELRCLVCQDESLAASQAALAVQLRELIYQMVQAGKTSQQIKAYMVARYGDFVLYKPPVMLSTEALWFGPFVLLGIGIFILWCIARQKTKFNGKCAAFLTDAEQQQLQKVLKE